MKLVHLIDSHEYVTGNCFQHQLLEHLQDQCDDYVAVQARDIESGTQIPEGDVILNTLKLRSTFRLRSHLGKALGTRPVYVYDQDPWESFVDSGTYRGAYASIGNSMNVASFLITSKWWSDFVMSQGYMTKFVPMWPLLKYCDEGPVWTTRSINLGFQGTLHPHRKRAVEQLRGMGLDVTVLPSNTYQNFLANLSNMQFFFHEEAGEQWTIDGKPIVKNCVWVKEIEAAARGCFALRKHEPESEAYNVKNIAGIITYSSIEEVPSIIAMKLEADELSNIDSRNSVHAIREFQGWFQLSDLRENT